MRFCSSILLYNTQILNCINSLYRDSEMNKIIWYANENYSTQQSAIVLRSVFGWRDDIPNAKNLITFTNHQGLWSSLSLGGISNPRPGLLPELRFAPLSRGQWKQSNEGFSVSPILNCRLRWLETLYEKCERNGFEHDLVVYYRVLRGREYHIVVCRSNAVTKIS